MANPIIYIGIIIAAGVVYGIIILKKKKSFYRQHFPDGINSESLLAYKTKVSAEEYEKFLRRTLKAYEASMVADTFQGNETDEKTRELVELAKEELKQYEQ